ncbi:MAG: IS3 family transposase [Azospirillum sp.]|nr:IS3 family transposase [Azospirillum sp.]
MPRMESFFGSLKSELVHRQRYPNRETAKRDLFAYIEGDYNRQRRHSTLGYITPEFGRDAVAILGKATK